MYEDAVQDVPEALRQDRRSAECTAPHEATPAKQNTPRDRGELVRSSAHRLVQVSCLLRVSTWLSAASPHESLRRTDGTCALHS